MKCANCGAELGADLLFCTNCGTKVAEAAAAEVAEETAAEVEETAKETIDVIEVEDAGAQLEEQPIDVEPVEELAESANDAAADAFGGLGASLESAVQANQQVIDSVNAHAEVADEAAARWAEAEAQAAAAAQQPQPVYQQPAYQQPAYQPPSYGQPDAPAGYVPPSNDQFAAGAAVAGGAAAAGGATPFYQNDVSPNAHYSSQSAYGQSPNVHYSSQGASSQSPNAYYSSQRTYDQNAYGQVDPNAAQGGYQQPSYGQPQAGQAPAQQWAAQPATKRAFMMVLYVSGLLGLIFALVVRDQDDEFITHHLNNNVVIFIGVIISAFLSVILIGGILAIYLFVMMIMGIVSAYHGDMRELPLIGKIHIIK